MLHDEDDSELVQKKMTHFNLELRPLGAEGIRRVSSVYPQVMRLFCPLAGFRERGPGCEPSVHSTFGLKCA